MHTGILHTTQPAGRQLGLSAWSPKVRTLVRLVVGSTRPKRIEDLKKILGFNDWMMFYKQIDLLKTGSNFSYWNLSWRLIHQNNKFIDTFLIPFLAFRTFSRFPWAPPPTPRRRSWASKWCPQWGHKQQRRQSPWAWWPASLGQRWIKRKTPEKSRRTQFQSQKN